MFKHIMVPVDLAHGDKLDRSLTCAADLARHWQARVTFVGVTSSAPGKLGHNPEEYADRLARFAAAQAELHGISAEGHMVVSHDPSVDLNKTLLGAVTETGADLVVMETHLPNVSDYIWASHGGHLAEHAKVSVMLVRG